MKNTKENIIIEKNKYLAAFWLMMALTVLLVALFFNILFNGTFVNTASFVSYIITSVIIFVLSVFSVFIISEIFLYIYFLPSILAIENNKPNVLVLYLCNLLFGVTIIGWLVTLVMSFPSDND